MYRSFIELHSNHLQSRISLDSIQRIAYAVFYSVIVSTRSARIAGIRVSVPRASL